MQAQHKIYLSGTGMITSIGFDSESTIAAIRAGINQFQASDYVTKNRQTITLAKVPEIIFDEFEGEIEVGISHSELMDREIKMAIIALQEIFSQHVFETPVPLILALPEDVPYVSHCPGKKMLSNLGARFDMLDIEQSRTIQTGRSGGIQALEMAQRYLYDLDMDYVLIGGSQSYASYPYLNHLDATDRVAAPNVADGFIPGEAAAFLLLTKDPRKSNSSITEVISIGLPGYGEESGHIYSDEPYRGEGLDKAFKNVLKDYQGKPIESIYSSMNGENYWAKEYGVASIRNASQIDEEVRFEHPADCYGDIGVATGPVLIALAISDMKKNPSVPASLAYCSSDSAGRSAIILAR